MDDLIALVGAVDGILQQQSLADADYFVAIAGRDFTEEQQRQVREAVLRAYRWQYIVSGVQEPRFAAILQELTTPAQMARIGQALMPILH